MYGGADVNENITLNMPDWFAQGAPSEKEEGEEEEEGEDMAGAEMEDPDKDDDEGSEPDTPLLTKQEKRALAIQRAKESMKEDKENVQRVLRKRNKNK